MIFPRVNAAFEAQTITGAFRTVAARIITGGFMHCRECYLPQAYAFRVSVNYQAHMDAIECYCADTACCCPRHPGRPGTVDCQMDQMDQSRRMRGYKLVPPGAHTSHGAQLWPRTWATLSPQTSHRHPAPLCMLMDNVRSLEILYHVGPTMPENSISARPRSAS